MILITGATGFIGAHLALLLLENGKSVRAIYRDSNKREFTRAVFAQYQKEELYAQLQWHQADLCDIPALETAFIDIQQVYHCAACISYDPKDEPKLRSVNIEGTANMVNLSLDFKVEKFAHLSSVAALGDPLEEHQLIDEETEWNPEKFHSDYAITKYGAEMEVWRAQQEGLDVVVLNPPVVIGPIPNLDQSDQGSGQIFRTIKNGFPFYTENSTTIIAVKDVVQLLYQLMESDIKNERFIATGQQIQLRQLAQWIADEYRVKAPHIKANASLLKAALYLDIVASWFGKKRQIFAQSIPALLKSSTYSDEKLQKKLSFKYTPIHVYLKDSIAIMEGKKSS